MTENFPNVMKDTNLYTQDIQQFQVKEIYTKTHNKLLKVKDKEF